MNLLRCRLCGNELIHGWNPEDPWKCRSCGALDHRPHPVPEIALPDVAMEFRPSAPTRLATVVLKCATCGTAVFQQISMTVATCVAGHQTSVPEGDGVYSFTIDVGPHPVPTTPEVAEEGS